jgi:comEA protein
MFNVFIEKYRWYLVIVLVVTVGVGATLIWRDKIIGNQTVQNNQEVAQLKAQNDLLRQQLSQQAPKSVAGATTSNQSDKININTATAEELDKLPNIGPARAADIITYRESHPGGFQTIEDIKNIKGIGDKYFADMENMITIGDTADTTTTTTTDQSTIDSGT